MTDASPPVLPPPVEPAGGGLRAWAAASAVAGGLWMLFSFTPIPFTTLLGVPFGLFAVGVGVWTWRAARRGRDRVAAGRARWALGLSCIGCLWQVAVITLVSAALVTGLPSLWEYLRQWVGG